MSTALKIQKKKKKVILKSIIVKKLEIGELNYLVLKRIYLTVSLYHLKKFFSLLSEFITLIVVQ